MTSGEIGIRNSFRLRFSPRFNNSHVRLARIGDPDFSGKLMLRLDRLAEVVPPQVRNIVNINTGGHADVECITLVGSAASFPSYSDFDINVLLRGGSIPYHKAMLRMRDEANRDFEARAGLSFHDVDEMDPYEYAVFAYAQPVLWGHIPPMFPNEIMGALTCAAGSSRIKALRMMDLETGFTSEMAELRKAAHYALTACRFIDTWRQLSGKAAFADFDATVKAIYKMERSDEFNPGSIEDICESIRFWQAGKQRPAWV